MRGVECLVGVADQLGGLDRVGQNRDRNAGIMPLQQHSPLEKMREPPADIAAVQLDLASQPHDRGAPRALRPLGRQQLIRQRERPLDPSRHPGPLRCLDETQPTGVGVGRQPRRALKRHRRGRPAAPRSSPQPRLGERRGGLLVRAQRGGPQMPGTLLLRAVRERLG